MSSRRERDHALVERNEGLEKASQSKSRFLASISHELRTPMNSILGFSELLQNNPEQTLTGRQLRNLRTIHRNAGNLLGLIDQLLDLSRIESGRAEVEITAFPVMDLIHEAVTTVQPMLEGKSVTLRVLDDGQRPVCSTDRAKLLQVVINLLSNAIKFSDEGQVLVDAVHDGDRLTIVVVDRGRGIPETMIEKIFEEFGQVDSEDRERGTGLGLPITRQLCRLLGGDISATSMPGQGSTFIVNVPLVYQAVSEEAGAAEDSRSKA